MGAMMMLSLGTYCSSFQFCYSRWCNDDAKVVQMFLDYELVSQKHHAGGQVNSRTTSPKNNIQTSHTQMWDKNKHQSQIKHWIILHYTPPTWIRLWSITSFYLFTTQSLSCVCGVVEYSYARANLSSGGDWVESLVDVLMFPNFFW